MTFPIARVRIVQECRFQHNFLHNQNWIAIYPGYFPACPLFHLVQPALSIQPAD